VTVTTADPSIVIIGGAGGVQGLYLLRLHLPTALTLGFGRFAGGRPLTLPAGDYLYVGSARGARGATTLAGRLLRHATRSGDQPPHAIRGALLQVLQAAALLPKLPQQKRCHWHIDYLLDECTVEFVAIYAVRSASVGEGALARWLMAAPWTTIVVPGLGASDDPGATHLLRIEAPADWWATLPTVLVGLVGADAPA
jgi:Uri superfamily endonuclease